MRFGVLALLLMFPPLVLATSFIEVPFEDTVAEAPIVVRGTVAGKRADWGRGSDGRDRIYTYFDLTVRERLKGDSGQALQILMRELGGEVGGVGMQVSGAAQFREGEDVVVFLSPAVEDSKGRTSYDVRGMMMGKYSVVLDESGEEVLDGAEESASEHPADRQIRHHSEAHGDTKPMALLSLSRLKTFIRTQGGGPSQPSLNTGVLPTAQGESAAVAPPAPGLQSSRSEGGSSIEESPAAQDRKGWILAFGLGLGSLLFLIRRLMKR